MLLILFLALMLVFLCCTVNRAYADDALQYYQNFYTKNSCYYTLDDEGNATIKSFTASRNSSVDLLILMVIKWLRLN